MAGSWYCAACQRVLTADEGALVETRRDGHRWVYQEHGHAIRWIAPWEDVPHVAD